MSKVSRRKILSATAAGAMVTAATTARGATFGNPDEPLQGAINTQGNPASATDPGPQNPVIGGQFPSAQFPPPTDVSDMPMFWASFNNAPKRLQNGGWARQVTQANFAIADSIAGVDMRLTAGGIREGIGTWQPNGVSCPMAIAGLPFSTKWAGLPSPM
jgi:oxalate decarboxylase